MRILLSSYAFCVGRGSEPGVGWNVAVALARRGHQVTVITTPEYKELNKKGLADIDLGIQLKEVTFPDLAVFDSSAGYYLWQKRITSFIKEECATNKYDIIHHVTFNQYRGLQDVFAAGIPYVVGPVGGAETMAPAFLAYSGMGWKAKLKECARYCSLDAIPVLLRHNRQKQQGVILASTISTANRLNQGFFRLKQPAEIYPAIALASEEIQDEPSTNNEEDTPYFLYYGSPSLPEKGIWLTLDAFVSYRNNGGTGKLIIVGMREKWHVSVVEEYMQQKGLPKDSAVLRSYIKRDEMLTLMQKATGVIYAGFRDSGGMSALEALAQGSNLICYDLPSQKWIPEEYAIKVPLPLIRKGKAHCSQSLANALMQAETMQPRSKDWHKKRAEWLRREMTWEAHAIHFEQLYERLINKAKIER